MFSSVRSSLFASTAEPCRETGKSSAKRSNDPPLAKEDERQNRPGRQDGGVELHPVAPPLSSFHMFLSAPAEDAKSEDVPEGRLNGDRETLDEMDESRKEEKNGFKAKFMFNIADGGFTGQN